MISLERAHALKAVTTKKGDGYWKPAEGFIIMYDEDIVQYLNPPTPGETRWVIEGGPRGAVIGRETQKANVYTVYKEVK